MLHVAPLLVREALRIYALLRSGIVERTTKHEVFWRVGIKHQWLMFGDWLFGVAVSKELTPVDG